MNQHTLTVLQFTELLEAIAGCAQSEQGAALVRSLQPSGEPLQFNRRRGLYTDLIAIRNKPMEFPGLHVESLAAELRQVTPEGAILDGTALVAIRATLDTVDRIRQFIQKRECQNYTNLQAITAPLDPCDSLRAQLTRCLDADGSVLDNASPKLRELRMQTVALEARIQRHLDGMLRNQQWEHTLQEHFVTTRSGRFVVPVKRDARADLPGIVHDLSNSGQTLFIEPAETVGWGNDLARTRLEERDEVRRILAELSAGVRGRLSVLQANLHILAELDAGCAITRWAGDNGCDLPVFGQGLRLEKARHPLLQMQFRREGKGREVVPLNLTLPTSCKALAVTGSNTGGKTVVLKTVGLLCLMAQSGLPVPVGPGSVFPVFQHILADIGDEQSLQENLSTFSAHVSNIAAIFRDCATGPSLVLLDELGGGTDPVEGGAIACGVLEHLAKGSTLTICTTHLALVKNYVHARQDMMNAAVRFDVKTLRPEYTLDIGRPGSSHALLIARRLGLPQAVLKSAEGMMSGEQLHLEDVLTRMEADQRRIARHADRLADTESDLAAKRDSLKAELEQLRTQRRQLLLEAHRQADSLVANTRREMENLIRSVREQARRNNGDRTAKIDTEAIRRELADKERRLQEGLKMHGERPREPLQESALAPGRRVWVPRLSSHGVIASVSGHKLEVKVNGILFSIQARDVEETRDGQSVEKATPVVHVSQPIVQGHTSSELNLIGMRVEDALAELAAFIDRSIRAQMPEVRIIHGFGTGRLRKAVQEWLARCPGVRSYHIGRDGKDPGAGGCTIVTFQ
ncbi:MAG: endonuclease MutS2 [Victivallales bacterium]|nr:endonuclease MutS2 [Victivallales bacterium]